MDNARRIGTLRAVVFAIVSALVPVLAHGTITFAAGVGAIAVTGMFVAWTRLAPSPRRASLLVPALVLGQALVHLTLVSSSHHGAEQAVASAPHAHVHVGTSITLAVSASMVMAHLLAAAVGAIVLWSLDRRAARFAIDRVVRLVTRIAQCCLWASRRRPTDADVPATAAAVDGRASVAVRALVRRGARRGPPALAALPFGAAA